MNTFHAATRSDWRRWLRANHREEPEVWLVFYKRHTGKPSIAVEDAIEEAICFGWIDSMVRRLDDERYARRFVRRKSGSTWSETNLASARKLIKSRKMTKAGLEALGDALETGPTSRTPNRDLTVPSDLARALRRNAKAKANFERLAPSYRRRYLGWIGSAKRAETRARRIAEAVRLIADGVKSIMK